MVKRQSIGRQRWELSSADAGNVCLLNFSFNDHGAYLEWWDDMGLHIVI